MSSWNWPALLNKISVDVPYINTALNALLKMNPTNINDIPTDAKRLTEIATNAVQLQTYSGTTWTSCGKLMHDADMLDGKHANTGTVKDTIPVRDANGALPGNITGNAATATSAVSLSEANPIAKGGTGATTSAAARTNLGVPPTAHKSTDVTYGVGDDDEYGHLKLSASTSSSSGTSGGIAATPSAVKAVNDACVHKTGDETISGVKTFTGVPKIQGTAPSVSLVQTDVTRGVNPSANQNTFMTAILDKDEKYLGALYNQITTSGEVNTGIYAYKHSSDSGNTNAAIRVHIKSDGTTSTYAPSPVVNSNDNNIATTSWVKSTISSSNVVQTAPISADVNVYIDNVNGKDNGAGTSADPFSMNGMYAYLKKAFPIAGKSGTKVYLNFKATGKTYGTLSIDSATMPNVAIVYVRTTGSSVGTVLASESCAMLDAIRVKGSYLECQISNMKVTDIFGSFGSCVYLRDKIYTAYIEASYWSLVSCVSGVYIDLFYASNRLARPFASGSGGRLNFNVSVITVNFAPSLQYTELFTAWEKGLAYVKLDYMKFIGTVPTLTNFCGSSGNGAIWIGGNKATKYNSGTISFASYPKREDNTACVSGNVPTGTVIFRASTVGAPSGYILCNGGAVSRTTYIDLFNVIGVAFGSGDGTTTFNIPNFNQRFPMGTTNAGDVNTYVAAGLPNIVGYADFRDIMCCRASGALRLQGGGGSASQRPYVDVGSTEDRLHLEANRSSSVYGNSSTVQPPAVKLYAYIKY